MDGALPEIRVLQYVAMKLDQVRDRISHTVRSGRPRITEAVQKWRELGEALRIAAVANRLD